MCLDKLTNEAIVPCHICPLLGGLDLVVDVQSLIALEPARWSEGGQLHVDGPRAIILLTAFCAPALLLLLVFVLWVDDLDSKRTLGPIILRLDPWSLANGGHGCRNEKRGETVKKEGLGRDARDAPRY